MFAAKIGLSASVMTLLLAACGGGGGGGSDAQASAAANSTSGAQTSSASSSSTSSQISGEPGSTALVGNDFEGIWEDRLQFPALITPDGMIYQDGDDSNLTGPITFTSNTWLLGANATDGTPGGLSNATGSGTFVPKVQFSGTIISSSSSSSKNTAVSWTYSAANGWAMPLSALAGTWQGLTIDSNGNVSGSLSDNSSWSNGCQFSGTFESYTPNTSKNLFRFTLTRSATSGQPCAGAPQTVSGIAAVMADSSSPLNQELVLIGNNPTTNERIWELYWPRQK